MNKNLSIFFVSSPLQVLAAQCIAKSIEINRDLILVFYKKNLDKVVKKSIWKKQIYMPWPRHDPEPGLFGTHKRLIKNITLIDNIISDYKSLHIYSAVYDTEAINYFVYFFKKKVGKTNFKANILPDGLISTRRHPLTFLKRILKKTRDLRSFFNKQLVYTHFSGDRIGSDAEFIDKIYVLNEFPHQYSQEKVVVLPPLVKQNLISKKDDSTSRALIIGQPLKGFKLMSTENIDLTTIAILEWTKEKKISEVFYKKHPKDLENTLFNKNCQMLADNISIEQHLSNYYYDYIIGVNSSVLLFAKQIYSSRSNILSFGINRINFKNKSEKYEITKLFNDFKIEIKYIK